MLFLLTLFSLIGVPALAQDIPARTETHILKTPHGTELQVFKKCPAINSDHKHATLLLFGGFETGGKSIELFPFDTPICLVTFQYPVEVKKKMGALEMLKYISDLKRAVHETLAGVDALVTWSRSQKQIDSERLVLVGASLGAPFTAITAARRSEVKALVLVHGFADVGSVIGHLLKRKWEPRYGRLGEIWAQTLGQLLWWYLDFPSPQDELINLRSHQNVLLLNAQEDDLIPAESVEAARESLRKSAAKWDEETLPGTHLRSHKKELIHQLQVEAMKWLRAEGILRE